MKLSAMMSALVLVLLSLVVPSSVHAADIITDGDLIKTATHDNVFIVKIVGAKKFKRLILNPDIFNQYAHLKWENIKTVSESIFGQYALSAIVREIDDQKVYQLIPGEDTGIKRWVRLTPQEFEAAGFDWDSIAIINQHERDSYANAADLTVVTLPKHEFAYGITPGISSGSDIDTAQSLGVDIVRVVPHDLIFAKHDLQSRSIDILVATVDHAPAGSGGVPPPVDQDAWARDLKNIVAQHPDVIYWEVWNEPNETLYWYPQPNAAQYVQLLKKVSVAIKEANPKALVITGGLSGINPPRQYLRDMYAAGVRGSFDVLALHPYHQPSSPDTYLRDYLYIMKNIMEANGDLDVPIWITEIGWPTDPSQFGAVTEQQQADYLRRTYEITQAIPFVQKVFWYRMQEIGQGFGILGKLAENVYRSSATAPQ